MMRRNLKAQMQADVKDVFLHLEGFARIEHIRHWYKGDNAPPKEWDMPCVITADENMNSVWNKNKAQQRAGNEPILYQMECVMTCAQEDFQPLPKKNRRIQVGNKNYQVLSVRTTEGILRIELRRLEE